MLCFLGNRTRAGGGVPIARGGERDWGQLATLSKHASSPPARYPSGGYGKAADPGPKESAAAQRAPDRSFPTAGSRGIADERKSIPS